MSIFARSKLPAQPTQIRPRWRAWLYEFFIAAGMAAILIFFVYQPVEVRGASMLPGVVSRERLLVNRFLYRFSRIHRGDIVVFRYPFDPHIRFIKRVIGLPGDLVEIRNGVVWINGRRLREPYLLPVYRGHSNLAPLRVPAGEYFVLGDHRNDSDDSRTWGCVPRDLILGKAVCAFWPPRQLGLVH